MRAEAAANSKGKNQVRVSEAEKVPFFFDHRLKPGDFSLRWASARRAAILPALNDPAVAEGAEEDLLLAVPVEKREAVLRAVFDNSRKMGGSLARFLGLSAEAGDFAEYLSSSGLSCFHGHWSSRDSSEVLRRSGACGRGRLGAFGCDFWREALDGLITGASHDLRLARHRSVGHGDHECVDVIFQEDGSGPKTGWHLGSVPEGWKPELEAVAKRFSAQGVSVFWDGFSEGTLFYRMEAGVNPLCGAGGALMHASLAAELRRLFPGVEPKDSSPLAVYGGAD